MFEAIDANKDAINGLANCVNGNFQRINTRLVELESSITSLYAQVTINQATKLASLDATMLNAVHVLNDCYKVVTSSGANNGCDFMAFVAQGNLITNYRTHFGELRDLLNTLRVTMSMSDIALSAKKSFAEQVNSLMQKAVNYYETIVSFCIVRGVFRLRDVGTYVIDSIKDLWSEVHIAAFWLYIQMPKDGGIWGGYYCYYLGCGALHGSKGNGVCDSMCNNSYCEYDYGDCGTDGMTDRSIGRMHLREAYRLAYFASSGASRLRANFNLAKIYATVVTADVGTDGTFGTRHFLVCNPGQMGYYHAGYAGQMFSFHLRNAFASGDLPKLSACLAFSNVPPSGYTLRAGYCMNQASTAIQSVSYIGRTGGYDLGECAAACDNDSECDAFDYGVVFDPTVYCRHHQECRPPRHGRPPVCRGASGCTNIDGNSNTAPRRCILYGLSSSCNRCWFGCEDNKEGRKLYTKDSSFTHTEISVGEVAENIIPVPEEASSIKQYACWAGVFVVACLVGKFVFGNQKTDSAKFRLLEDEI